jgi:DNA mismatch repair protein MLH1
VLGNVLNDILLYNQDEIVERIQQECDKKLLGANVSRTFYTQTLLPGATAPITDLSTETNSGTGKTGKEEPKNMVRTDAREQKLDKFLKRTR